MSKAKTKHKPAPASVKTKPIPKKSLDIWYYGGFIFIVSFLLYSNTFGHKFVLDDFGALADNWVIKKGVSGIPIILTSSYRYGINMLTDNLYRPLSQIMFAIEWQISPQNPMIHHLINVLFYALSTVLLYLVLRKYFSKIHPIFLFLITLLFAVHPIHTEVVANIKSRDEIMSFFFLMGALYALHGWFTKGKYLSLGFALIWYFLAFMAKEGVITMLALFPILGWYFTTANRKKLITASLVMLIPAGIYLFIRSTVLSKYGAAGETAIVDNFLNAAPDVISYFATAIMLMGKYLGLLFVPTPLVSDYSFNQIPIVGLGNWAVLLSLLTYGFIVFVIITQFTKKSPLIFGLLFFIISMSIYSNLIIPIGSSFGERFLFLPSLGFCIALVFIIAKFLKISTSELSVKDSEVVKKSPIFISIFVIFVFLFSIKTVVRAAEWKDQYTLFGQDVKRSPNSAHLRYYWGLAIRDRAIEQKNPETQKAMMFDAIAQFDKAVSIYASYPDCYEQLGLAWYRVKDGQKAMDNYEKALRLNPKKAVTWSNLGIIYFEKGDYLKSFELYSKALSLDSNYADGYFNMGSTLGMLGKFDEAIENFKKCILYDPDNAKAHQFIAITYQNLHREAEAKPWFEKAAILEQKKATEKSIK